MKKTLLNWHKKKATLYTKNFMLKTNGEKIFVKYLDLLPK